MTVLQETDDVPSAISSAAADPELIAHRHALARFTAQTFAEAGIGLHISGDIFGSDRVAQQSPHGHGGRWRGEHDD